LEEHQEARGIAELQRKIIVSKREEKRKDRPLRLGYI